MSRINGINPAQPAWSPETSGRSGVGSAQQRPRPKDSQAPSTQASPEAVPALQSDNRQANSASDAAVQQLLSHVNEKLADKALDPHDVSLVFKDEVDSYVVEIREKQSGDLIMQFPPEELLELREGMQEIVGSLVDRLS